MKARELFLQSAQLYFQASTLDMDTRPLRRQLQENYEKLKNPITSESRSAIIFRVRELEDEVFSRDIEIQVKRLRAKRLMEQSIPSTLRAKEVSY